MRLLLDTHIFLALIGSGSASLPATVVPLLENEDVEPQLLDSLGVRIVPIDERHALAAEPTTCDPFDRMLLAQCQIEDLRLVTLDRALVSHPLAARP